MASKVYKVYTVPHAQLRKVASPIEIVDDEIRQIFDDLLTTMVAYEGAGLAATQVGINKRMLVMEINREGFDTGPLYMANPTITHYSEETSVMAEGCLSVPGVQGDVTRPDAVVVEYIDYHGTPQRMEADGLLARCIQHEMDHLDGKTYLDHLSPLKRRMLKERSIKYQRRQEEE